MVSKDTTGPHDTIHHARGRVQQNTVGRIGQGRQIMRPTTAPPTSVLFSMLSTLFRGGDTKTS